ncbi:tetratricopeptide repeat protein [Nostoc sp. UIC 10630]|uniref:tetratricopeptide repeat protein n=1 Tax=Nostoc sp. UIC 10630 TaxID=2100146 RepID=UPI0013D5AFCF|nr:tetratricopeptide repeat protein [Nostoc sp. UIC 10630]NEU79657.1 tetratricopeptide repeat protein [Nostoc sp. UIC 10630]
MNPNLSDWDDDLPPEPEEAYQDLLRALKRKSGFGLFFVQCTPGEADNFIVKLPQEIPQKKIAVLRLVEAIDNLYQPVVEFIKGKEIDILLIKGLEYSLYKYEKRSFGEITEGQFGNLTSVPHILNHLNQQRERFRDDFSFCFVFLLRSFSINYLIHRAPDFFDWRSGVFELPTTPEVVEQESTRLLLEGDYEEYLKLSPEQKIEKVLEIQDLLTEKHQPDNQKPRLLFKLGNLLYAANEYEAAIASYDQALKFKPDLHQAWNNRGIALRNLERNEEAIASFDKVLEIKPDDHQAWSKRGIALGNLGHHEEAIASFDKVLGIKPDDHQAWGKRGIALGNLGHHEEAIASFDKVLKIKPDDHQAWGNRGIALGNLGHHEEAIASYDQALTIEPDNYVAWNNRGSLLCDDLQRHEEAIASFEQALKLKPDDYEAWNGKGNALFNLGRNEEAIASFDEALKIQPDYHHAWKNRGYALYGLLRYNEAFASFDKVLKIQPNDYQCWNNQGYLLLKKYSSEGMIPIYEKALEIGFIFQDSLNKKILYYLT